MRLLLQLIRLGFLSPRTVFSFLKAKKIHGHNLCLLLKVAALRFRHKVALTDGLVSLSFDEQYKEVTRLSSLLLKKITTPGQSVALFACSNSINHILILHALQNAGIQTILLNSKALPGELNKLAAKQNRQVYIFSADPAHLIFPHSFDTTALIKEVLGGEDSASHSKKHSSVTFTTSGTTGKPKLIEKKKGIFYSLRPFTALILKTGIHKRNAVFIAVPISHGFGYTSLLFALVLGKKTFVTTSKNYEEINTFLLKEKIDLISGVPASLYHIAENIKHKNHHLKLVISGGAALNEKIFASICNNISKNIFSLYGSTEASTSFIADYPLLVQNIQSIGKPLSGIQYKIEPLENGSNELVIKSPLANITSTWLHTGDLVMEDKKSNLIWCGRNDDMIIKNGVNIYPVEIENELLHFTEIEDVYVSRKKDMVKGETIVAYIKMKPGFEFNEQAIISKLRVVLPGIKIPDLVMETSGFEYTNTGKKKISAN
jgi:fatty-acyl-CoA synthase